MLGQRRRQWANIDLILFPEFYKQTIKKTIKKMKSRVVDEGCGARGSRGFSRYPFATQVEGETSVANWSNVS